MVHECTVATTTMVAASSLTENGPHPHVYAVSLHQYLWRFTTEGLLMMGSTSMERFICIKRSLPSD